MPQPPPQPLSLELRQLSKSFGSQPILDNISLRVPAGGLLAVLGPSGCGKSTLLRIVAGLEAADTGSVLFDEKDVSAVPAHQRPCHTVFQSYALFPHLSVRENVAFGPRVAGVKGAQLQQRVDEALELVRIASLATRKPDQLSGGQQQRVALARSLVNRPALLLLDEPFSALDRELREDLQEELREIRRKVPMTVLFVTHDHDEAFGLSTCVAVIDHGRVLQFGAAEELYRFPATGRVAELLGIPNVLMGEVTEPKLGTGNVVVTTPIGTIEAVNADPGLQRGDRVNIFVRSASIVSAGADATGLDGFEATVLERAFCGDRYRLLVRTESVRLRVEQCSDAQTAQMQVGTKARFACEPGGVFVYRATA